MRDIMIIIIIIITGWRAMLRRTGANERVGLRQTEAIVAPLLETEFACTAPPRKNISA